MDYKERLAQFEAILSTKDLVNDPIIDLYKFRHLCFCGIPDKPGIRQKSWKILLGYLPTDKRKWQKTLSENRMVYYSFVRDLLAEPSEEELNEGFNSDHPLNPAPNSKWAEYFADNIILEQIDKDVCRTLPDFAFFQQPVPQSPLSPLSPRLQSESELNRLNEPQSPSLMEKLDSLRDVIALRSNDNEHQQLANGDGTSTRLEIASSKPSSIQTPINSLTSTSKVKLSSRPTPINTESVLSVNSIIPVRNRRSIFRRVQHLNKAFFRRENQPNSLSPTKISDDPCEDDNKIDLHWEAIERILFIYAKLNPGIGYVQGMNEILGPIYYTMANDGDEEGKAHAEADSFFVFTSLMADIRDHFVRSLDHDDITGIGATMTKMNRRLKAFSYELWEDLEHKSLHAPYYSFRWLTVMCAQEFALPDVIRVWDSVFADHDPDKGSSSGRFEFLIDFCCAMIICVKDELLQGAFEDNIKLLQHYPIQDPGVVLQKAYQLRESRLLAKLNGNEIYTSSETEYGPDGIIEDEEPRKGSSGRMWLNSNGLISSNGSARRESLSHSVSSNLISARRKSNNHQLNKNQPQNLTNPITSSFFRRPIFLSATQQVSASNPKSSSPSSWLSPITNAASSGLSGAYKSLSRSGPRDFTPLIPASVQTRVNQVAGQTKIQGLALFNKVKDVVANQSALPTIAVTNTTASVPNNSLQNGPSSMRSQNNVSSRQSNKNLRFAKDTFSSDRVTNLRRRK